MIENDNLMIARVDDITSAVTGKQYPLFLGFLNEHDISIISKHLNKEKSLNYRFFGGYPESDRNILAVSGNSDYIEDYYYPIVGLCFKYKSEYRLSHRDFLGSLMSLGIKRDFIGDILTGDGKTVIFVKEEIKNYIITQIQKIGKVGVSIEIWNGIDKLPANNDFENINCTVSSARLDSIISAIVPFSREKSALVIKQGMVFVNSVEINSVSYTVKSGEKISIRGKGKFVIEEFSGVTKKGRLKIIVKKYK